LTQRQKVTRKWPIVIDFKSRVGTGAGKPVKSWNSTVAFSRTGKSSKRATGPGKFWNSVKLK